LQPFPFVESLKPLLHKQNGLPSRISTIMLTYVIVTATSFIIIDRVVQTSAFNIVVIIEPH
jgi:hypothetical protein